MNHAIDYYLHVGSNTDMKLRAMLSLFAQMTSEPAFDQLRTKEQLGYIVFSGFRPSATTMGYMVLVQSERTPDYLESRVNAFLLKFGIDLDEMSEQDFEGHRRSLINKRLEKVKNLESETGRLWGYIGSEYFDFYQIDNEVAQIRSLTKTDMRQFYGKYIDPESPTRSKLSVHMIAKVFPSESPNFTPEQQKEQLVELVGQSLSSAGSDLDPVKFKQDFEKVDMQDEMAILSTIESYVNGNLPAEKAESVMHEAREILGSLLVALKIRAPVKDDEINGTEVAAKIPTPVIVDNVDTWKASLMVSEGPRPVTDLSEFEEIEPKL